MEGQKDDKYTALWGNAAESRGFCGLTMEAILIKEDVVFVMILLQQLGRLGRRLLGQTAKVINARLVQ